MPLFYFVLVEIIVSVPTAVLCFCSHTCGHVSTRTDTHTHVHTFSHSLTLAMSHHKYSPPSVCFCQIILLYFSCPHSLCLVSCPRSLGLCFESSFLCKLAHGLSFCISGLLLSGQFFMFLALYPCSS